MVDSAESFIYTPSLSYLRPGINYLPVFESALLSSALYQSLEMLKLATLENIIEQSDSVCLQLPLSIGNTEKSSPNAPANPDYDYVTSILLSIESHFRLLVWEIATVRSISMFNTAIEKLGEQVRERQALEKTVVRKDLERILKFRQRSLHVLVKMIFYERFLQNKAEVETHNYAIESRLVKNRLNVAVESAIQKAGNKENAYFDEISHYELLLRKEKNFRNYLEANKTRISFLENEIDYWTERYDTEMESIETKKHETEDQIDKIIKKIIFHKDLFEKRQVELANERASHAIKRWIEFVRKRSEGKVTAAKNKDKNKKPKKKKRK